MNTTEIIIRVDQRPDGAWKWEISIDRGKYSEGYFVATSSFSMHKSFEEALIEARGWALSKLQNVLKIEAHITWYGVGL